jgi:hypothetical protein
MTLPRLLVIMGSGETAPTMVKVHRSTLDRIGRSNVRAVMLDTPFGFQENASELCAKTIEYFSVSLQTDLEIASLRSSQGNALAVEQGLGRIRNATYVFAGPGSPTYALSEWTAIPAFRQTLVDRLAARGAVVFSSAASLTLGTRTVPVYEIYKAGASPHWLTGLNVLTDVLPGAVVIPHFDNAEGGGHDTRFCYLGERRLQNMESMLSDEEYVFGIDEHTAAIFDLDSESVEIVGRGGVTIRRSGASDRFEAGSTYSTEQLVSPSPVGGSPSVTAARPIENRESVHVSDSGASVIAADNVDRSSGGSSIEDAATAPTLAIATEICIEQFRSSIERRDSDGAAAAVLALDDAMFAWASDPGHNDHAERARAALRGFVVQLGNAATAGLADPDEAVRPLLDVILKLRAIVRGEKRFDLSDVIRDELGAVSIEVRDTPTGPQWSRK